MKKTMILTLLALSLILSCSGCGTDKEMEEPVNIAFVLGIADGHPVIELNENETFTSLPATVGSDYAFLSVDGALISDGKVPDFTDQGYTDQMLARVHAGIRVDLESQLASFAPVSGEIDMANVLELAVRSLHANAAESRENILLLCCSGLSTTGLINMIETPLYQLDLEAFVPAITDALALDMSGIDVIWYYCGDVGEQAPLNAAEKRKLQSLYEQIFLEMGADSVTFKADLPNNEEYYHFPDAQIPPVPVQGTQGTTLLPEEVLRFQPDSAVFADPAAAAAALQPIADHLMAYPETSILIYGTCATDRDIDSEHTLSLGKARAQTVKDELLSAGIDESRIAVVCLSVEKDPYYQFGLGTGKAGSVNRKTVIVDMSSELAKGLMAAAQ